MDMYVTQGEKENDTCDLPSLGFYIVFYIKPLLYESSRVTHKICCTGRNKTFLDDLMEDVSTK